MSLFVHIGRTPAHGKYYIPSAYQQAKVLEEVVKQLPRVPYLNDPTNEYLQWKIENFLAGSHMNWQGSPGYPFAMKWQTNADMIKYDYHDFVVAVLDLLIKWRDTPHEEVAALSAEEAYLRGLYWPQRLFVKREPHSDKKLLEGRLRLIQHESIVVSVAHAILLQDLLDVMIANHSNSPIKTGMGLDQQGIGEIWRWVQKMAESCDLISCDVSCWDWTVAFWLLLFAIEVYIELRHARGSLWERMLRNGLTLQPGAIVVLSDGRAYVKGEPTGVTSGGRSTAAGNSVMRISLAQFRDYTPAASLYERSPPVHAAMGDDDIESLPVGGIPALLERYEQLGFRITDILQVTKGGKFDFCSHLFLDENTAIPQSWQRTIYKLLNRKFSDEDLQAWLYEMRHLSDPRSLIKLVDLVDFLHWVGWLPTPDYAQNLIVPHCALLFEQRILQMKGGKSKQRVKAAKAGNQPLAKQTRAVAKGNLPTRALKQQMSSLISPLTRQEEATLEYAHTLANPWIEEPAGCPLILGSGTVRTNKAQLTFEGSSIANSAGFAFVAVDLDGWVTVGPDATDALPVQFTSYSGGTQGTPIWYSAANFAGGTGGTTTSLPAATDTTAITGLLSQPTKLLDGTVNNRTGVRLVAAGLRVFSDAAVNTAQGKLAVIAASQPTNTKANGGLPLAAYADISGAPQDLVSFETRPCAGWKSGEALHVVGIPTDPSAFQLNDLPAAGSTAFGYPQLAAILTGGASGQTFTWQVVFDYEFTFSMTNLTGVSDDPIYNAGPGAISNITSSMAQQGAAKAGPMALTNGKNTVGVKGWLSHVHATQPGRAPEVLKMATMAPQQGGFFNNVGKTLSKVAHGALGLIGQYAPGWLGTAAKAGKGVLDFLGF
jgi:hypothetical protein